MKVKEVIAELQNHNPDTPVVIRGYESGFNRVLEVHTVDIVPNATQENWYDGEYEKVWGKEEQMRAVPAVELWGDNTKKKDE